MACYDHQVTPFGNLRIKAHLPLPEAYRSLSRPSSPVGTKAFTVCPIKLDSMFETSCFRKDQARKPPLPCNAPARMPALP
jgi:hypothetical protein